MYTVLAGSYAPPGAAGIREFRLDPAAGQFTETGARTGLPFPAFLARSAAAGCYYAVGETTSRPVAGPGTSTAQTRRPGTIWWLGRDPAAPDGPPAHALATGGELPTHIAVHPSGRWLCVANYGVRPSPGSISVVRLHADGSLAVIAGRQKHAGTGPDAQRQDCAHVHSTIFSPAGDRLIAADLGSDALTTYAFDARTGRLTPLSVTRTPPGWGPRYLAWVPGEQLILAVGELSCEIGVFAFHDDALELVARVSTLRSRRRGILAADIRFSPDGQRAYVSNRGAVNSIATFDTTRPRRPELIGTADSGGSWPRHLALTADGRYLVIANEHSGQLSALPVDSGGLIAPPLAAAEMPGVSYVEVRPA